MCCLIGVGWEPPEVQTPVWCPCPGWPGHGPPADLGSQRWAAVGVRSSPGPLAEGARRTLSRKLSPKESHSDK